MVQRGFLAAVLLAPASLCAQSEGLTPEWDVRATLKSLVEQNDRLKNTLSQLQPKDWVAKGAPEAYAAQHKSALDEIGYLARASQAMSAQPDKLSLALEVLFRAQAVESMLQSLAAGVERYQNPALADLLRAVAGEGAASRSKLRQYAVELAANQEVERRVLEQEAQRCRVFLSKQPPPAKPSSKQEQKK